MKTMNKFTRADPTPEWCRKYRRQRRHPITQLLRLCRRNAEEPFFILAASGFALLLAYALFLAFIWALVNSPMFR
ncbi:MAG TPA: hypothetical protein VGB45_08710 [Abditibacterium sp.]|jgi:hypothetical protein